MKTEINKAAALIVKDRKILMCRKVDKPLFVLPGGSIEENETSLEALKRELKEELDVELIDANLFGKFEGIAEYERIPLKIDLYEVEFDGVPKASSEIVELKYLDSKDKKVLTQFFLEQVLPILIEKDLID